MGNNKIPQNSNTLRTRYPLQIRMKPMGEEAVKNFSPLLLYPCPRQYWQDGKPSYWLYFEGTDQALPHAFSFAEASEIRQSCRGTREEAMDCLEALGLLNDGLKVIRFQPETVQGMTLDETTEQLTLNTK